jgi:hypothetical protein
MAFDFSIAGITTVRICADTWQEEEVEYQGVFRRTADGAGQNSQRSPKRGFTAQIFFTDATEFLALQTATTDAEGVPTPVTVVTPPDGGTMGAALTCYCWLGRRQAVKNGDSAYWRVQLQIREA